jgi:PTS system nitrogen regulatory IIA component
MKLKPLLSPTRIALQISLSSKKKSLQAVSELLAKDIPSISKDLVFDALTDREKLGSTGLGDGIAIPHCRYADCCEPLCAIITLTDGGVSFDASDGKNVDLLWALIVPIDANDDHLQTLALMAEKLSQIETCKAIRQAQDPAELYLLLTEGRH